jgi:predicted phosphodiesterase
MYQHDLTIQKGIKNKVRVQFKNSDQKRINISSTGTYIFSMFNVTDQRLIVEKTLDVLDAGTTSTRGTALLTLTESDTLDLDVGNYQFTVKYQDPSDGTYLPTYSNTYYGVAGQVKLLQDAYPVLQPSQEVISFLPTYNDTISKYEYKSGNIYAYPEYNSNSALHTLAMYMTAYKGRVYIQGTLSNSPASGERYVTIATRTYTGFTGIDYVNFNGIFTYIRIVHVPDATLSNQVQLETPTVFGMLGDSGQPNPTSLTATGLVADKIKEANPDFVIHLGDSNYGEPLDLQADLLDFWQGYLNRMYIAFGNHDLDYDYGSSILDNLPRVNNAIGPSKRADNLLCYDFVQGQVHFFVLNSGDTAAGDGLNETNDPNIQLEAQLTELVPKIENSTSQWKIILVHRPPYTNSSHAPGSIPLRLDYASLGIDAVISAHDHVYEYIEKDGVPYFVQGLGGANIYNLNAPYIDGTIFAYNDKYAYTMLTATTTRLKFDTYSVDDDLVDSRTFNKTAPVSTNTDPNFFGSFDKVLYRC